jgi:hypothetical protein
MLEERTSQRWQELQGSMPHLVGRFSLWRTIRLLASLHRHTYQHKGADREKSRSPSPIVIKKRVCSSEGLRPAYVALRFLLSTLLMSMKDEATDRFMGDTILICHLTKWFVVLYHTMDDQRPVFSGNTVVRVFWPWSPLANY